MVDLTSVWPSWGSSGTQPSDGTDHSPGDNPKAENYNHLWHHIRDTFSTIESWISDRETAITVSNKDATVKGVLTLDGDLSDGTNTVYDRSNGYVPQARLENDTVTVAGNNVSLGGSVAVEYVDLSDTGTTFPIPNSDLANTSVTVAGNSVSLGGSTAVSHSDLNTIGANQHHSKDHDHTESDISTIPNSGLTNSSLTVAGNSVALGGATALSADDLSDIATSSETAGQILIWHSNNGQYENASLAGGNAVSVSESDASVTVDVVSNSIKVSELDTSITPSWSGTHTFSASTAAIFEGDITDGTNTIYDKSNSYVPKGQIEPHAAAQHSSDDLHSTSVETPTYQSLSDVPNLSEGAIVYVKDENEHYYEDGT
jgi:hypothetical protein